MIYPFPVEHQLQFYSANAILNKIEIIDLNGRIVLSQNSINANKINLDVNSLSSGIYITNIFFNQRMIQRRFIKK